jgi:hypothetical protein
MGELSDDFKEYRERKSIFRQNRADKFDTDILPKLQLKYDVYEGKNSNYIIDSNIGVVDYFSKSDKLLIRSENKWINNGKKYIIDNIL